MRGGICKVSPFLSCGNHAQCSHKAPYSVDEGYYLSYRHDYRNSLAAAAAFFSAFRSGKKKRQPVLLFR